MGNVMVAVGPFCPTVINTMANIAKDDVMALACTCSSMVLVILANTVAVIANLRKFDFKIREISFICLIS